MTHASAHEAARQSLAKLGIAPGTATAYLVHDAIDRACPTCEGLGEIIADLAPEADRITTRPCTACSGAL